MIDNSQTSEPTKIYFTVGRDESAYPSVSREQLWCLPVDGDRFTDDNIPFYARDVSMGDEVSTEMREGERWFSKVLRPSRNSTVRTVALKPEAHPLLGAKLESFGALTEKMEASPLVALSLPPTADIAGVMHYLDRESDAGNVDFEESCVRYK